jgi:hypothetical protein
MENMNKTLQELAHLNSVIQLNESGDSNEDFAKKSW